MPFQSISIDDKQQRVERLATSTWPDWKISIPHMILIESSLCRICRRTSHGLSRSFDISLPVRNSLRRPKREKNEDDRSTRPYDPIFALNWQKSSQKNLFYDRSPFIVVEPEWVYTWSKQYDSYKRWYHQKGINQDPAILPVKSIDHQRHRSFLFRRRWSRCPRWTYRITSSRLSKLSSPLILIAF